MTKREGWIHVHIVPDFKPGDPCPEGYLDRHEWARVQLKAGYRQGRCPGCGRYQFEFEMQVHRCRTSATAVQP